MKRKKPSSASPGFLWIALFLANLVISPTVAVCPRHCLCTGTVVKCLNRRLTTIPDIPDDTTVLELQNNHIREVPSGVFANKVHLHTIFLNQNEIESIHRNAFNDLSSLKYLYLNKNRIRALDKDAFHGLGKLVHLHLLENQIQDIHEDTFTKVPRLERLYLSGNRLTTIQRGLLDKMNNLKVLRLDANPLRCDCTLKWLLAFSKSRRISVQFVANCGEPLHLRGRNFNSLTENDFKCTAPEIVRSPASLQITPGSQIVMSCEAVGDPKPEIRWTKDEEPIRFTDFTDSHKFSKLPNGALQIEGVSEAETGEYRCQAVNQMGEVRSTPARVSLEEQSTTTSRIHPLPSPGATDSTVDHSSVIPDDLPVALQDTISLDCHEIGETQFSWEFNGQKLIQSNDRQQIHSNGTLIVLRAKLSDGGLYKCTQGNRLVTVTNVRVIESPEIVIEPEGKIISPGDSFVLECEAIGSPKPELRWTFNGAPVIESDRVYFEVDNQELHVELAQRGDTGEYRCIAESSTGTDDSLALVQISSPRGPPRLAFEPYDLDTFEGSVIEVPCQTEDGVGEVRWKKDGRTVVSVDRFRIAPSGSLFISNVTVVDSGRYECSVVNDYGRVTASGVIAVKGIEEISPGEKFVRKAFADATQDIDKSINNTIASLFSPSNQSQSRDYGEMFRIFRFPNQPARELARATEIYERTLYNLRKQIEKGQRLTATSTPFNYTEELPIEYLDLISSLSGCTSHRLFPNCSDICFNQKYRTVDGTCNNLANPTWGSSLTGFRRLLPPIYEDDFAQPVGWEKTRLYNGFPLPSPRFVSTKLISTATVSPDSQITHMVMQWGQFLDHDLDHTLPAISSESFDGIDCKKSCELAAPCYPIQIPENDPRVSNRRCLDFVRSSAICGSGQTSILFGRIQPREQINQLTTYIDGSQVYGYTKEYAHELRNITGQDGTLRHGVEFPGQKLLLPFASPTDGIDCRRNIAESNVNCFTAGDVRVNEQVGLLAMHTVWFREHNRIALDLKDLNPQWDPDTIYQESRKIVGAQMQHITFKHWLPLIVGEAGMDMLGPYSGYDPNRDSSISNEFATAALRFGHSLINPILSRFDHNHKEIPQGHLPLHKAFFAPWRLVYEGGVDPLMRGMFLVPAKMKKPQQSLNSDLTEKLFTTAHAVSLDLAAINIQRSRDHAIPGYNEYRRLCNLTYAEDFEGLQKEISDPEVRKKLKEIYGHVNNIDIWVGGILEDQVKGGRVGPLFRCLLVEQFRRLRDGDRFYYENPSVFKVDQLTQIKQSTLGRVLCDSGDNITRVTEDVFVLPEKQGGFKECSEVRKIDLRFWMECSGCTPRPHFGGELRRTPRFRRSVMEESIEEVNAIEDEDMNVEDIIGELKQMRRRIKELGESCLALKIKKEHSQCTDTKGVVRLNDEAWKEDECTNCECKNGQVNCVKRDCVVDQKLCKNRLVKKEGECCPVCA